MGRMEWPKQTPVQRVLLESAAKSIHVGCSTGPAGLSQLNTFRLLSAIADSQTFHLCDKYLA